MLFPFSSLLPTEKIRLDLNDFVNYQQELITNFYHDHPAELTSTSEYVCAAALIMSGLTLYTHPATRNIGIRLIQLGFSLIGYSNLNDFCQYLGEKGWFSDKDWNIFREILGEVN